MTEIFNAVQQSSTNLTVLKRRRGDPVTPALGGFYNPSLTNTSFSTASSSALGTNPFGVSPAQSRALSTTGMQTSTASFTSLPEGETLVETVDVSPGTTNAISQSLRRYWAASYPMIDDQFAGRYGPTFYGGPDGAVPPLTGTNAQNVAPRGVTRGRPILPTELEIGYLGRKPSTQIWTPPIFTPSAPIFDLGGTYGNEAPYAYPTKHQVCASILENYKILVPYQAINLHFLVVTDIKVELPLTTPAQPNNNQGDGSNPGRGPGGGVPGGYVFTPKQKIPIFPPGSDTDYWYLVVFITDGPDGFPNFNKAYGSIPEFLPATPPAPPPPAIGVIGINNNYPAGPESWGDPNSPYIHWPGWEEYGGITGVSSLPGFDDTISELIANQWLDIFVMKTNDPTKDGQVHIMPPGSVFGTVNLPLTGGASNPTNKTSVTLEPHFVLNNNGIPVNNTTSTLSIEEAVGEEINMYNIEIGEVEYCVYGPRCVEIFPGMWSELGAWLRRHIDDGTFSGYDLPSLPVYTNSDLATGWTGDYDPVKLQAFWNRRLQYGEISNPSGPSPYYGTPSAADIYDLSNVGLQWSKDTAVQQHFDTYGTTTNHKTDGVNAPTPAYIGHPSLPNGLQVGRVTSWKSFGNLKQLQDFHTSRAGLVVGPGVRTDSAGNIFRKALALRHKDPSRNPGIEGAFAINQIHLTGYITDRGPTNGLP